MKRQLTQITMSAGFKLRKWCANNAQLLEGIPAQDLEVNLEFDNESSRGAIKTLGLIWRPKSDELRIKTNQEFNKTITKRTVTSEMARIYDPLGLIAPVIVKAKVFIQGLWQLKIDWDAKLPEEHQKQWSNFRQDLNALNDLSIPRHVFRHKPTSNIELHVFSDASERAYGAAVYVRAENKDNTVTVQLLCSKSRVAPLKTQTIPRLELCAALLGAELITKVKEDLHYNDKAVFMWTDSEIVLHWINSQSASFQTFVSHRIAKLQQLTSAEQWRHVGSKHNPADVLSRGLSPADIKNCTQWFLGPFFLHGKRSCWPPQFSKDLINCPGLEIKKPKTILTAIETDDLITMIYRIDHRGSFLYLQRVVGYILRFVANTRKQNKQRNDIISLSTIELDDAMMAIVKAIQQSEFKEEIIELRSSKHLKSTKSLASLTPFLDSHGIMRVGGRLQNSQLSFDARHPILLPYNDNIATLIMRQLHENNLHCGPQALLAQTRQRFWPVKGKIMARSIVQHCIRCTRAQPKVYQQIMGNLPKDRVQLQRPFLNTGVDFCGPIWIHYKLRGKRPCKAYIAVFCCFATKAVHLELVSDLTTDAFIGALNRFIYRRGRCQNLYCDNATNFVGANNQLQELNDCLYHMDAKELIYKTCTKKGIEFHFIPPRAPHFGGLWEAAVKSAKNLLVKGVGNASLTYEELETAIVQIEGILNSRPITPMSSDPNDLLALTPGHFIIGEPITSYPEKSSTLQRWKLVKSLKDEFWSRWSKEYLNELQYRGKWKSQLTNVEPGTMVIIKEDNIPPLHWPLGRVTKTYPGDDGLVRVVELKTTTGTLKRAIHRLAPLFPIDHIPTASNSRKSSSENNETPTKKPRLSAKLPNLFTIIALILCLPLVFGQSINITKYNNDPGIHFENIGKNHVVSTYWNLVVYYDLEPLKSELSVLKKGTAILEQTCQQLKNDICKDLIIQFSQARDELASDVRLFMPKRTKRGAINVVGNVANALFGVLDSEYAKKMSESINEIEDNEHFLLNLIKNQTSIIDSTINIIKSDQEITKAKFDLFDKSFVELKYLVTVNNQTLNQQKLLQSLWSLAVHLIITTTNMQRTQTMILNVLTDVHHGKVGPLLLTPEQLKSEISNIKAHLPVSVQFPVQQDLLAIYKLMSVQGGLTENHILFKISIPLIGPDEFNIYKVYPIPATSNRSIIAIQPTTEYLSITAHGDKYYPMTQQQINTCTMLKEHVFLCPFLQSIHNKGSSSNRCEVNFYNNETTLSCHVMELPDDQWIQLNDKNQWIFALKQPIKLTAVCGKETTQVNIEGSGILKLKPECIVKNERFTLLGHQVFTTSVLPSITTQNQWSHLHDPKTSKPIFLENAIIPYHTEVRELLALQKTLKNQQILQLPHHVQQTKYHMFGIGYTSLVLVIIIALYTAIKKYIKQRHHRQILNDNNGSPTPAPRRNDFSIHL